MFAKTACWYCDGEVRGNNAGESLFGMIYKDLEIELSTVNEKLFRNIMKFGKFQLKDLKLTSRPKPRQIVFLFTSNCKLYFSDNGYLSI